MCLIILVTLTGCGAPGTYYGHFSSDLYDAPSAHAGYVVDQLNRCPAFTGVSAVEIHHQATNKGVTYVVTCD